MQTLSQAVEMLREDVGHERDRADQAERRIDELLHELADARTAAMITGCEAAALRSRLEILTEQHGRHGGDGGSGERVMSRPGVTLLRDDGRR
jgi:hypothetical protein